MKLNKIYYLAILGIVTGLTSCDKDDDLYPQLGEDPRNISEIVSATEDLSVFNQAMTEAELDSILSHSSTYTVFAPENAAFDNLSGDLTGEEFINTVRYHVVPTTTADFSHTLTSGYVTTMATGPDETILSLFINAEGGSVTLNNEASFVDGMADIGSTNGVLHVINDVLDLPTVPDHIEANPDFSILAEAIERVGLSQVLGATEVTDTENPEYPVTLFAPTNAAFENLLTQLNGAYGWSTIADVPDDVLQEILRYHVVTGGNLTTTEVPGTEQITVHGDIIAINANAVISDQSYSVTNIVLSDIQATNGVIHATDRVLLPGDIFQGILDQTLNLRERLEDRGYSSFLAAAEKVGLTSELEDTEFTVFVPSNEAFEAFFGRIENFESLDDFETEEELELLRSLLEYHLYAGTLLSSQLTDGDIVTVQGDEVFVDTGAGALRPSFEYAPNGAFAVNNIGATNGVIHEISNVLVSAEDAEALGYPIPSTGGPEYGLEIYHDELNPDFWFGWTNPDFANTDQVFSGDQAIRLDYGAWEALQLGSSDGVDVSAFSTIDFAAYSETGTNILVYINGQNADGMVLNVPAGEWTTFSIPLAEISTGVTTLTEFAIQDQSGETGTIYYDQIGLDVTGGGNAAPTFDLPIYTDGIQSGFSDGWDGWGGIYTWNSTEVVQNGETSIKLEYLADSWGALQIGGAEGVNATDYATFNFSAYGAPGSGTTPLLVNLGGTDDGVNVEVVEGEWTTYSIPVSQFPDTSLGEIRIKNTSAEASTIYIDNIGFNN